MSKSYSFTDEQASYITKMAKARGIDEKEAAQNLMDKGISRDKALSKYSGSDGKPKAKGKAKAAPKAKGKAKAAPKAKKARAKVSAPKEASKANGSSHPSGEVAAEA